MSLAEKVVKIDEMAKALDRSEDWIKRNWLKQHQAHGMPRKLPTSWTWPRRAMERWIDEQGGIETETADTDDVGAISPDLAALAANSNARLRERYAGGRP